MSVAAATLLFEAVRQRQAAGLIPTEGEGLSPELFDQTLFEWAIPRWRAGAATPAGPIWASAQEGSYWKSCRAP